MSQISEEEREELVEDLSPEQLEGIVFSIIASRLGEEHVPNYCVYLALKVKTFLQDLGDDETNTSIH